MTPRRKHLSSINTLACSKENRACASKYEPLLPCGESSLIRLKQFVYRCQMYNTTES